MSRSDGDAVLTMVLWDHDGVPVARIRSTPSPGAFDWPAAGRMAVGRRQILELVDDWITAVHGGDGIRTGPRG